MSEYDQRQYRLMLEKIGSFEQGHIRLDSLIADLDGLLNVLEEPDLSWKEAFQREWGKLEDERADALFRNTKQLDKDAIERLSVATAQLRLLVLQKI